MHAQPSLVGLEPSRAAKFCSASSSQLSVCESGRNCQDCAQISVLDFIGSTKIS